jgi:uncharacterized protein (TIGR03086 family)
MDIIELLEQGYAWTAARIAPISAADLDAPTPCGRWNLRDLLDHTIDTLGVFVDAVAGAPSEVTTGNQVESDNSWVAAITELAARSRQGWSTPGALDRTYEMRFGTMPGHIAASANLLEVVVHGWDISQATGEATDIPLELAEPILEFAQMAIGEEQRGVQFADDLGTGDTPSERLVAFLGRKPT